MGESDTVTARCPSCGKYLSLKQLAFGAEHHAIQCRSCGERLIKRTYLLPLLTIIGLVGFTAAQYLFREPLHPLWHAGWVASLVGVALLSTRVRVAGEDVPDAHVEQVRDGPPPQSIHFRGSSGPPPKRED